MIFINRVDSRIFPASDCCLAMVPPLEKNSVLRVPNSEDDFAQLVTAIFSESLKIDLNHNLEKGPNRQKWMST